MIDSDYASNFRSTCYKCSKIEHNMRNCADIDVLINQKIIHQDDIDHLAWDKKIVMIYWFDLCMICCEKMILSSKQKMKKKNKKKLKKNEKNKLNVKKIK